MSYCIGEGCMHPDHIKADKQSNTSLAISKVFEKPKIKFTGNRKERRKQAAMLRKSKT